MKYIVCREPGTFELRDKPPPERKVNEALLKVRKIGICGTDLHAYMGNQAFFSYPRILGHELAAEVVEIGKNPDGIRVGDRVVVMPYVSCGSCIACRKGKTNCCTEIRVLGVHTDGGMQEFITVPSNMLLKAPDMDFDQMAIIEPLAIAAHAIRRAAVQEGEFVVVVGCGPIGIGILKLAHIAGAKTIAVDMDKGRLDYAGRYLEVEHLLSDPSQAVEQIAQITKGDMATVVFDATGQRSALENGIYFMAHGGRYVLVGLSKGDLIFRHPTIHARETTLLCSRNATREDFEYAMKVIALFPTTSFITHQVSIDDMIANFDSWTRPGTGVIKALVYF